ncbi:MAG: hypothetical protein J6Q48_05920 [Bacteroidaceae bacterium]|nr:hypothetical protein [Bacteroidaceae bacterium]
MLFKRRAIIKDVDITIDPFNEGHCAEILLMFQMQEVTPDYVRNYNAPMTVIIWGENHISYDLYGHLEETLQMLFEVAQCKYFSELIGKTVMVQWDGDHREINALETVNGWAVTIGRRKYKEG